MAENFGVCGIPEALSDTAAATLARWSKTLVTWTLPSPLPQYTHDRMKEIAEEAMRNWEDCCGIELRYADRYADITLGIGLIDGPGKVLAWSELPNGSDSPLRQRYDTGEDWDDAMALGVIAHEGGHALGLPHGPQGALLAPYFNRDVLKPQEWDRRQMVARYGPPRHTPPPPPSPTDPTAPDKPLVLDLYFADGGKVTQQIVGAQIVGAERAVLHGYKVLPL
jgi:hypothetical protein